MRSALAALLDQKGVLLADGASGTNFMAAGLEPGYPPDLWNLSNPEKPRTLHQAFIDAGADIILTNTFGANAPRLKLHKAEGQTRSINEAGARIAAEAAAAANRPVVVAGSVGPTGELFEPLGAMTLAAALDAFSEQMEGLKKGGADVIWIETMSAVEEIAAAVQSAARLDIPYVVTASFDTAGKTMMGLAPDELPNIIDRLGGAPIAFGANCGVGAPDLLVSILALSAAAPEAIIIAKANCGIPVIEGKKTVYSGTPAQMAHYVTTAIDCGARIIGGCCGTEPAHIAAMRAALDAHAKGDRPQLVDIENRVGPISRYGAQRGSGENPERQPHRRRARRKKDNAPPRRPTP